MTQDQKTIYREEAKKARSRIIPQKDDFEKVRDLFFEELKPSQDKIIAGYWPIDREFDPRDTLDQALQHNMTCCLPRIQNGSHNLQFLEWNDKTHMAENQFGILEPQAGDQLIPDIVIVPLLAFDRRGHRLGYGGGYYDCTIKSLRDEKDIITAGFAYAEQACLFHLPTEQHDQALDLVITPDAVHKFS